MKILSPAWHRARHRHAGALALCLLLAGCGTSPPATQSWVGPSPEDVVREIRASGQAAPGELDVQPLRDPMVEDLRARAVQLEQQRQYDAAGAALDKALALAPNDPALLQERAEVAVLQKNLARADALARRAFDIGARVGPLCRRNWATIRQYLGERQRMLVLQSHSGRQLKADTVEQWKRDSAALIEAVADADRNQAACTLTGPPRY